MEARIKMTGLNKPKRLSNVEKGRARLMRIQEAETDGRLQEAKNRVEVVALAGFMPDQVETQGRPWIQRMVRQHKITETLTGFGTNGKPEYEYHLAGYVEKKNGRPKNEDVMPIKVKPVVKLTLTTSNGKLEIEQVDTPILSMVLDFLRS